MVKDLLPDPVERHRFSKYSKQYVWLHLVRIGRSASAQHTTQSWPLVGLAVTSLRRLESGFPWIIARAVWCCFAEPVMMTSLGSESMSSEATLLPKVEEICSNLPLRIHVSSRESRRIACVVDDSDLICSIMSRCTWGCFSGGPKNFNNIFLSRMIATLCVF